MTSRRAMTWMPSCLICCQPERLPGQGSDSDRLQAAGSSPGCGDVRVGRAQPLAGQRVGRSQGRWLQKDLAGLLRLRDPVSPATATAGGYRYGGWAVSRDPLMAACLPPCSPVAVTFGCDQIVNACAFAGGEKNINFYDAVALG